MARFEKVALPVGAPGTAVDVSKLRNKYLQAEGGYTGTFDLEGSVDGSNYETLQAAVSAGTIVAVPESVSLARIDDSSVTVGAADAVIAGFNERVH